MSKKIGIFAICTLLSGTTHALSTSGQAHVYIQSALGLYEKHDVSFGSISQEVNGVCDLENEGLTSTSDCQGTGQLGEIILTGEPGQSVSVVVAEGESSGGVVFEPALRSDSAPVLTDGEALVKVGGRLTTHNPESGAHTLTYTITVNYN